MCLVIRGKFAHTTKTPTTVGIFADHLPADVTLVAMRDAMADVFVPDLGGHDAFPMARRVRAKDAHKS